MEGEVQILLPPNVISVSMRASCVRLALKALLPVPHKRSPLAKPSGKYEVPAIDGLSTRLPYPLANELTRHWDSSRSLFTESRCCWLLRLDVLKDEATCPEQFQQHPMPLRNGLRCHPQPGALLLVNVQMDLHAG